MIFLNHWNAILALGAITAVNAGPDTGNWGKYCRMDYDNGISFTNEGQARSDISRACYGWPGNRGAFQDLYFKPWNESPYTAQICVNQPGNTHLNIEIGNLNPNVGFVLNNNDCNKELQALVWLGRGAEAQNYGWYFRVDPNAGSC